MESLVASGRILDVVLALMAVEAAVLALWRRRTGAGLRLPDVILLLLPGAGLVLAARALLTGAAWTVAAAWLALALAAHAGDVVRRWRAARVTPAPGPADGRGP
jgi:hypothetical protein